MSKQVPVVVVAERSTLKKITWLLVIAGVVIYAWQSPAEAASAVRTVVSGVFTFIRSL
jgi:hypothetical protein